jgi:hypothetical protein
MAAFGLDAFRLDAFPYDVLTALLNAKAKRKL